MRFLLASLVLLCAVTAYAQSDTSTTTTTTTTTVQVSSLIPSQFNDPSFLSHFDWTFTNYSACIAAPCGATGTTTRIVVCAAPSGNKDIATINLSSQFYPRTSDSISLTYTVVLSANGTSNVLVGGPGNDFSYLPARTAEGYYVPALFDKGYIIADDAICGSKGPKPASTKLCTSDQCMIQVYETPCSADCGGGFKTVSWACMSGSDRVLNQYCNTLPVPGYDKSSFNNQYALNVQCNTQACTTPVVPVGNYTWSTGSWSACSIKCGPALGQSTRTVYCIDANSKLAVPDSNCVAADRPVDTQECHSGQACPWVVTDWNACGAGCTPSQTRLVYCADYSGNRLEDSACYPTPKPATSQVCANRFCYWQVYDWSQCINGAQNRNVKCIDQLGNVQPDADCAAVAPRPVDTNQCQVQIVYYWLANAWGTCVNDVHSRTVACYGNGQLVADEFCGGAKSKPPTYEACQTAVEHRFFWTPTEWNTCTLTRNTICADKQGIIVDQQYCAWQSKPIESAICKYEYLPLNITDIDLTNITLCSYLTKQQFYFDQPILRTALIANMASRLLVGCERCSPVVPGLLAADSPVLDLSYNNQTVIELIKQIDINQQMITKLIEWFGAGLQCDSIDVTALTNYTEIIDSIPVNWFVDQIANDTNLQFYMLQQIQLTAQSYGIPSSYVNDILIFILQVLHGDVRFYLQNGQLQSNITKSINVTAITYVNGVPVYP